MKQMEDCLIPIPDGRCEPLPQLPHASPDGDSSTDEGVVVSYICERGHMYQNETMFTIQCTNREWTNSEEGCRGEINIHQLQHITAHKLNLL